MIKIFVICKTIDQHTEFLWGDEMKDFFISYNKKDKEFAKWIAGTLEEYGYTIIIQAWDFEAGNNFILEMHNAIKDSGKIILVLSENYLNSEYCQAEWSAFFNTDPSGKMKNLLPIRISDVKPNGLLSNIVYIDLFGLNEKESIGKLLNGIGHTQNPRTKPKFPATYEHNEHLVFKINSNGETLDIDLETKQKLRDIYLSDKDPLDINVDICDERLEIFKKNIEKLSKKQFAGEDFNPEDEYNYAINQRCLNRAQNEINLKKHAIIFFLKDMIIKGYCINSFTDMLDFIYKLLNYDYYRQPSSEHIPLDCYIRANSKHDIDKEYYFILRISQEELDVSEIDYKTMQACGAFGYYYTSDFKDKTVFKKVAVGFYFFLACEEIFNHNKKMLANNVFLNLLNYSVGLH